jgi:hypothetical protein
MDQKLSSSGVRPYAPPLERETSSAFQVRETKSSPEKEPQVQMRPMNEKAGYQQRWIQQKKAPNENKI